MRLSCSNTQLGERPLSSTIVAPPRPKSKLPLKSKKARIGLQSLQGTDPCPEEAVQYPALPVWAPIPQPPLQQATRTRWGRGTRSRRLRQSSEGRSGHFNTDRGGGGGLTTAPKKGSNGADGEEAKTACRRSDRTRDTDRDPVGIGAIPNAVAPRRRRIWRG